MRCPTGRRVNVAAAESIPDCIMVVVALQKSWRWRTLKLDQQHALPDWAPFYGAIPTLNVTVQSQLHCVPQKSWRWRSLKPEQQHALLDWTPNRELADRKAAQKKMGDAVLAQVG